jgi:hypothetical protein
MCPRNTIPKISRTAHRGILLAWLACGSAAEAAEVTFDLRVERGQVPHNMRLIRVKQRDVVKLRWSTDRPLTLHLHGYELEQNVEPGAVAEMTFTARAAGRFPVHIHDARGRANHSHDEPPLVRIEVYPQ